MRYITILMFSVMTLINSCKSIDEKIICLTELNNNLKKNDNCKNIVTLCTKSINEWIYDDISNVKYLSRTIWKVDNVVFFNSSQNQAILLLLEQDTSINAKMDDINLIYAKLDNDKWKFYYTSMPVITAERYYNKKVDPKVPYTFQELSYIGTRKILEGGYFRVGSCKINDNYISKWYTISLEEKNKIFHRR